MLETAMMGFIGMILGAIGGALFTMWFTINGFSYPGMEEMVANFNLPGRFYPRATLFTMFAGPMVVFLFTLAAAVYPALRLHRLHPVEAMRTN